MKSEPKLLDTRVDPDLNVRLLDGALKATDNGNASRFLVTADAAGESLGRSAKIDFTFRNNGTGVAVLWKVAVVIDSEEIDRRPVMSLRYETGQQTFELLGRNTGWGSANCQGELHNAILETVFLSEERHFNILVPSDEERIAADSSALPIAPSVRRRSVLPCRYSFYFWLPVATIDNT
jgi:hypothetical protein